MTETKAIIPEENKQTASLSPLKLSYESMERANGYATVMFHHMLPLYQVSPITFFRDCGPIVNFLFSMVYEADSELDKARSKAATFCGTAPAEKRIGQIITLLKELELYDSSVQRELDNTLRYFELTNTMMYEGIVTPKLVKEGLDVIPGDVVVAHKVCHRILNIPCDAARLKAIHSWVVLWVVEADLIMYADSVAEDFFNFYRMFVKLYGQEAPQYMEQERTHRIEALQRAVAGLPEHEQESFLQIMAAQNQLNYDYFGPMGLVDLPEKIAISDSQFPYRPVIIPEPIQEK